MNVVTKTFPIIAMCFLLMGVSTCSHKVKYESDRGMLAPYQAEVLEFPVMINGNTCKDMSGKVGACTKIVSERQDIKFEVLPLGYSYNFKIRCSAQVNFSYEFDAIGTEPHTVVLPKELYQNIPEFICTGRVTPSDRNFVSSRFELRVRVFDGQYVQRGEGQVIENKGKMYLNMGKNALHTYVFDNGKWSAYKKKTLIKVDDVANLRAFSESEIMRINFYNF